MAYSLIDPKQLKRIRSQLGMTQARLASESGVSQSMIAKIEAGNADPSFSSLKSISQALRSKKASEGKKAGDVMVSPVVTVQVDAKLRECIAIMKRRGISQLPVMSGERPVGSVTEAHLLGLVTEAPSPAAVMSQPVKKFMSPAFPVVDKDTPVEALNSLFTHMPLVLVSSEDRVEGVIAKIDLLAASI